MTIRFKGSFFSGHELRSPNGASGRPTNETKAWRVMLSCEQLQGFGPFVGPMAPKFLSGCTPDAFGSLALDK